MKEMEVSTGGSSGSGSGAWQHPVDCGGDDAGVSETAQQAVEQMEEEQQRQAQREVLEDRLRQLICCWCSSSRSCGLNAGMSALRRVRLQR